MADSGGEPQKRERLEPSGSGLTAFERQLLMRPPERPKIEAMPRSSVFGRLQDFLPKMAAANDALQQQLESGATAPEDLDIENVGEGEEGERPVIEMDLACGLFDIKDEKALAAAEQALRAGPLADNGGNGGDSSDSDSDTSSSGSEGEGHDGERDPSIRRAVRGGGSGGGGGGDEEMEEAEAPGSGSRGGGGGGRGGRRKHGKRPLIQEVSAADGQQQQQQEK